MHNNRYLITHARSTWLIAVENCKKMVDGLIDFEQMKMFVTTLHNAIEINLKQIMLDYNDHDVLVEKDNSPLSNDFKSSTNLNEYFINLNHNEVKKMYTIEFSKLIDKFHNQIPNSVGGLTMKGKLNLLNRKRNQTTHFYANELDFLNQDEFADLYELAFCFCEYIKSKGLLSFFGNPFRFSFDVNYNLESIDRSELRFKKMIKDSETNSKLLNQFNYIDDEIPGLFAGYNSFTNYDMAYNIFYESEKEVPWIITKIGFYEFYRRLNILISNNLLKVNTIKSEVEDEKGSFDAYYESFICKK